MHELKLIIREVGKQPLAGDVLQQVFVELLSSVQLVIDGFLLPAFAGALDKPKLSPTAA